MAKIVKRQITHVVHGRRFLAIISNPGPRVTLTDSELLVVKNFTGPEADKIMARIATCRLSVLDDRVQPNMFDALIEGIMKQ